MTNERKNWRELCQAAAKEHNPEKLLRLVTELNDTLEKMKRKEREVQPSPEHENDPPRRSIEAHHTPTSVWDC